MDRSPTSDDFDSPWKDALQVYLPFFLAFFFPDIHDDIDWSPGYEALDKEFQKIARRAKVGKRLADKLFKVWLKDGAEHWLLIHIEFQADYEKEFPERMFDYNSAVHQLYNKNVVSLAVLGDDRPAWRPTTFAYGRWGCRMELTFRIAKVLDYAQDDAALEASPNPVAVVVWAHCQALATRRDPEARRDRKLQLVKRLFQRGWSKEDVRQLFRLIDWIMTLPEDLEAGFHGDIDLYVEENKMEYVSSYERVGYKKGLEEGLRKGLLEAIAGTLKTRFGAAGRKLLPKVRALSDLAALRQFKKFLDTATSLDEVREYLQ